MKIKFCKLCCISRNNSADTEATKSNVIGKDEATPSIGIMKKEIYHILTSVGSNLELSVLTEKKQQSNSFIRGIYFPKCDDIPGILIEKYENILERQVDNHFQEVTKEIRNDYMDTSHKRFSKLSASELQRYSDTMSDISSMTLKDILDQYETSSPGSPTSPTQKLNDLISLKHIKPRKCLSKSFTIPSPNFMLLNNNETGNKDETLESSLLQSNEIERNYKESFNSDKNYQMVESITLKPIGKGINSLTPPNSMFHQLRSENIYFSKYEPDSPITIPPRMPILPELPIEAYTYIQNPKIPINNRRRNMSYSIIRSSQAFDMNDNDDIYQDIDLYNSRDLLKEVKQKVNYDKLKYPPSKFGEVTLKRSSSAEFSCFSHLPTKTLENNIGVRKPLLYSELKLQTGQLIY